MLGIVFQNPEGPIFQWFPSLVVDMAWQFTRDNYDYISGSRIKMNLMVELYEIYQRNEHL